MDKHRPSTESARERVADFWDDVLRRWLSGEDHVIAPLDRWMDSYRGTGEGAVDLAHYPDPYVGDLRGIRSEPRLVVLGLNPGVGYDGLQGPQGIWSQRIQELSYSRCFERSPAEDATSWNALHGKPSAFWARLTKFAQRWLQDPTAGVADILNLELYPWHSNKVNACMCPPADLINEFIWEPVQEIDVPVVFAFGSPWFETVETLGLPRVAMFGPGGAPFPAPVGDTWKVGAYRLPSGQLVVISSQQGYAGPPGPEGTDVLRAVLADLTGHGGAAARTDQVLPPPTPRVAHHPSETTTSRPPFPVGATLQTVVLSPPAGDHVVTWDEQNLPTAWTIDQPTAYASLVGQGRTARTVVEQGRYREVGLLDPQTGSILIPDRYPSADGGMTGHTFQLTQPQPAHATPPVDIKAFIQWLRHVLSAAANRGEFVVLENGGWDYPPQPYAFFTCAQDSGGAWLSHLEAAPSPTGSQVWPPQPTRSEGSTLSAPATLDTVEDAALLLIDAISEWAKSPLLLGATFGEAPNGPCTLKESR